MDFYLAKQSFSSTDYYLTKFKAISGILFLLILLCTNCPKLHADQLRFNNGDKLSGKFIKVVEGKIIFEADLIGEVKVKEDDAIVIVAKSKKSKVKNAVQITELKPDNKSENNSKQQIENPASEIPSKELADKINWKNNAFFKTVDRVRPFKNWKSKISVGFKFQNNQTDKEDISIKFESKIKKPEREYKFKLGYNYGKQIDVKGNRSKSNDSYKSSFKGRFSLDSNIFLESNSRYKKDLVKNIDNEFRQSLGLGWRIFKSEKMRAAITPSITLKFQEKPGISNRWDYLATLFQDFHYKISKRISFHEEFDFSYDPQSKNFLTADLSAKLKTRISKSLSLNLNWEIDYDNVVSQGIIKNQERLFLNFGYKF